MTRGPLYLIAPYSVFRLLYYKVLQAAQKPIHCCPLLLDSRLNFFGQTGHIKSLASLKTLHIVERSSHVLSCLLLSVVNIASSFSGYQMTFFPTYASSVRVQQVPCGVECVSFFFCVLLVERS